MSTFASKLNYMLFINRHSTNPYVNLATEEYILKNFNDDCFMLWINEPCIIIGKHQNALAEINLDYVKDNNIPVIRRLSGGGAVFHDLGNLNFTFICNEQDKINVNFKKFTQPILDILNMLGVNAQHGAKNDLLVNGKKISGNAEHIWKKRVLHHGTLLFSSNINNLSEAIKVKADVYTDKAVKSNRSEVTNISEHFKERLTINQFYDLIFENLQTSVVDFRTYDLTTEDFLMIDGLVENKYSTWEWNFGYSPKYDLEKTIHSKTGKALKVNLNVKDGIIISVIISGDYFEEIIIKKLEDKLINTPHYPNVIKELLVRSFVNEDERIKELFEVLF